MPTAPAPQESPLKKPRSRWPFVAALVIGLLGIGISVGVGLTSTGGSGLTETTPSASPPAVSTPPTQTPAVTPTTTPEDTGLAIAQEVAATFPGATYTMLTSEDGYMMKSYNHNVPFGLALAVHVEGKEPGLWRSLHQAVMNNMDALREQGFKYVLLGFPDEKPHNDTVVMGYTLPQWEKWSIRPYATLGLITSEDIQFNSA